MNKENWEKEFNKKFGKKNSYGLYKVDRPTEYKKIKQFIKDLLDKQRDELKKKVEKMRKDLESVCFSLENEDCETAVMELYDKHEKNIIKN